MPKQTHFCTRTRFETEAQGKFENGILVTDTLLKLRLDFYNNTLYIQSLILMSTECECGAWDVQLLRVKIFHKKICRVL